MKRLSKPRVEGWRQVTRERCRGTASPVQCVKTDENQRLCCGRSRQECASGRRDLRKELYATSAVVRTDALVLTISDATFNLSVGFSEEIGTCGNAYHLSGLSAETPTLTCRSFVDRVGAPFGQT